VGWFRPPSPSSPASGPPIRQRRGGKFGFPQVRLRAACGGRGRCRFNCAAGSIDFIGAQVIACGVTLKAAGRSCS
jgi:hypothetical protein